MLSKYIFTAFISESKGEMEGKPVRIEINGLEVYAKHGYFEKERLLRQRFLLNIVLDYVPEKAEIAHLSDCVDYESVIHLILDIMKKPVLLLETLADNLNESILSMDSRIQYSKIRIQKYPLVGKKFNSVLVERSLEKNN